MPSLHEDLTKFSQLSTAIVGKPCVRPGWSALANFFVPGLIKPLEICEIASPKRRGHPNGNDE
jgi:hypothetical protein